MSTRAIGIFSRATSRTAAMAFGAAGLMLVAACGAGSSASGDTGAAAKPSVAPGQAVAIGKTKFGAVLVDTAGKTLYGFAADKPGKSNCNAACLAYWPLVPAKAGALKAPSGVSAKLGSITRADGQAQLTVNNMPVYTYVADTSPGTATGQGTNISGGRWWVVGTNGSWIKTMPVTGGRSY
jgi:predicted lipoprotein with Yx(FWY)xxD motif